MVVRWLLHLHILVPVQAGRESWGTGMARLSQILHCVHGFLCWKSKEGLSYRDRQLGVCGGGGRERGVVALWSSKRDWADRLARVSDQGGVMILDCCWDYFTLQCSPKEVVAGSREREQF
jgi:hypothetical protein